MSLDALIPEIWAARLQSNLHKNLVYGQPGIINRDYEGEINDFGDTVRINSIGAITVGDYVKDTNIGDPETLTAAQQVLLIDQQKYFNFQIDDIDKAQGRPQVMDAAMGEAGYALADIADQYVAAKYVEAATANLIGTTASPKTDLASAGVPYNYLVDLGTKLDESNIPRGDRWVVVPPWFHAYLVKDARFSGFGTGGNLDVLRNGMVGRAAGFDVFMSNNVPNTSLTKYRILAGVRMAITFADQIRHVEGYRPEKRFADAMKGLHLYGSKVTRPTALAVLTANPT